MSARIRLAALSALVAASVSCHEAPDGAFRWPLPEGWRNETIPFPLEFAADLPFSGVEELRFAPGMFDPEREGYWSYAFVWWLEGRPQLGAPELESALRRYFSGLITEVSKEKGHSIDPARFAVTLRPSQQERAGHTVHGFEGTAELYDAFTTGMPLTLQLEIGVWDCAAAGKRAALVLASPRPRTDPIWRDLRARRDEFACHPL